MKLELFYFDSCPFCQNVLQVVEDLNITVELLDISKDQAHLSRLLDDTGKRVVPCLYVNDSPMFESQEIIDWLNENKTGLAKKSS